MAPRGCPDVTASAGSPVRATLRTDRFLLVLSQAPAAVQSAIGGEAHQAPPSGYQSLADRGLNGGDEPFATAAPGVLSHCPAGCCSQTCQAALRCMAHQPRLLRTCWRVL
jgi:hypothetical protein